MHAPKQHSDIPFLKKDVIVPESQNENTKFHPSEDNAAKNAHPPSKNIELNFRKFFLPVLILLFLRNWMCVYTILLPDVGLAGNDLQFPVPGYRSFCFGLLEPFM